MSTELAVHQTHDLSREKIDLIKQTVAKGATDLELELFLHACKRTGLDPLMKQMYAVKRWSNADKREVMSFQTGIDGYRLIADRTGLYAGSDEPLYEEANGMPAKSTVTVYKIVGGQRCAFSASARWSEYVQANREGQPTSMWKKMPYLMLAKCAEALALRKAFPAELSGVYTHEEMMQADNGEQAQAKPYAHTAKAKIAELMNEGLINSSLPPGTPPPGVEAASGEGAATSSPAPSYMDLASVEADYEAAFEAATTADEVQSHWDAITKDSRVDTAMKAKLFQVYRKAGQRVGRKR